MIGPEHPFRSRSLSADDGVQSWHRIRHRLDRRFRFGAAALALLALTAIVPPAPILVWNASASAPTGLYLIMRFIPFARGDMVLARLPDPWRQMAATRHYLPEKVPLVKQVAAGPGDMICASGSAVSVNGRLVARRLKRDRFGRILPWWDGCHRLVPGEIFLLMHDQKSSFDGRYFGATRTEDVIGTARLLWAR